VILSSEPCRIELKVYMHACLRNVRINPGGTIYNRTRQCLTCADNTVIVGISEGYIKKTLEEMVAITQQIGLLMNDTKTKYMLNRLEIK
jgi:hypothetical protein